MVLAMVKTGEFCERIKETEEYVGFAMWEVDWRFENGSRGPFENEIHVTGTIHNLGFCKVSGFLTLGSFCPTLL